MVVQRLKISRYRQSFADAFDVVVVPVDLHHQRIALVPYVHRRIQQEVVEAYQDNDDLFATYCRGCDSYHHYCYQLETQDEIMGRRREMSRNGDILTSSQLHN